MSIFGNEGDERLGKSKAGEQSYRGEGGADAPGALAGSKYASELGGKQKEEQAALLRADIRELDENIQAITASIESLVAKIQAGRRIAGEKGSERLSALNARLEEAAQQEKMRLVGEKELLEAEKQELEKKLSDV